MRIGKFDSVLHRITEKPWSLCQLLPMSQKITDGFCKKRGYDTPALPTLARSCISMLKSLN